MKTLCISVNEMKCEYFGHFYRLKAEQERLERIGPMAYYSEWVKAWKGDTSREAIQKHYEETGEDENMQLVEMFCHQTAEEFRIMMGTDVRIKRDPLAMRMREDQIKQSIYSMTNKLHPSTFPKSSIFILQLFVVIPNFWVFFFSYFGNYTKELEITTEELEKIEGYMVHAYVP